MGEWFDVDYISPRSRSITPGALEQKPLGMWKLFSASVRLCFGRYDVLILPAFRGDFQYNASRLQKWIRKVLASGILSPVFRLFLSKPFVIILDRDDVVDIQRYLIKQFHADLYLKSNVRESDLGEVDGAIVSPLPYWISRIQFDEIVKRNVDKDIDLFFAGNFHQGRKDELEKLVATLSAKDLKIVILEEKVDLATYYDYLNRSRLVLSPSGLGWHCFRHFEALAAGAVPVINRSLDGVSSDLQDGVNAIIYQNFEDAAGKISRFFSEDRNGIEDCATLQGFVREEHLDESVGTILKCAVVDRFGSEAKV